MGTKKFTGQVPLQEYETFSKNTSGSCRFSKNIDARGVLWESFVFLEWTWPVKCCEPIVICEEGQCDGKMRWDSVRWTLLRIRYLPLSCRNGFTFCYKPHCNAHYIYISSTHTYMLVSRSWVHIMYILITCTHWYSHQIWIYVPSHANTTYNICRRRITE